MKSTAIYVMMLEHTSVEFASVLLTSSEEHVNVQRKSGGKILRPAADPTTQLRHCAAIVVTVSVENVIAGLIGIMRKKLYLETSVNVITSPVTNTMENFALDLIMENASVDCAGATVNGGYLAILPVSAGPVKILASPRMENT